MEMHKSKCSLEPALSDLFSVTRHCSETWPYHHSHFFDVKRRKGTEGSHRSHPRRELSLQVEGQYIQLQHDGGKSRTLYLGKPLIWGLMQFWFWQWHPPALPPPRLHGPGQRVSTHTGTISRRGLPGLWRAEAGSLRNSNLEALGRSHWPCLQAREPLEHPGQALHHSSHTELLPLSF